MGFLRVNSPRTCIKRRIYVRTSKIRAEDLHANKFAMFSFSYRKLTERDEEVASLKSELEKIKTENESLKVRGKRSTDYIFSFI